MQVEKIKLDKVKHDRFRSTALRRTKTIMLHLKRLGNCSNKNYYQFLPNETQAIFEAIKYQTDIIEKKFTFDGPIKEIKI